jgi:hypothetical protein
VIHILVLFQVVSKLVFSVYKKCLYGSSRFGSETLANSNKLAYLGLKHINGYNVKGLQGQIMTFEESRKTKNIKKGDITFLIFKQLIWLKYRLFYFFK